MKYYHEKYLCNRLRHYKYLIMIPVLRFSPASDQVRISLVRIFSWGTFSPGGEWFPCVFRRTKFSPCFPQGEKKFPSEKKSSLGYTFHLFFISIQTYSLCSVISTKLSISGPNIPVPILKTVSNKSCIKFHQLPCSF